MPFRDPVKLAAYNRAYYQAHREECLARYRANYAENREEVIENKKRYLYINGTSVAVGMTRRQRQKFIKEMNNGEAE